MSKTVDLKSFVQSLDNCVSRWDHNLKQGTEHRFSAKELSKLFPHWQLFTSIDLSILVLLISEINTACHFGCCEFMLEVKPGLSTLMCTDLF